MFFLIFFLLLGFSFFKLNNDCPHITYIHFFFVTCFSYLCTTSGTSSPPPSSATDRALIKYHKRSDAACENAVHSEGSKVRLMARASLSHPQADLTIIF